MTPHIEANLGDFAKTVLMPGDPLRAKLIADNFLTSAKLISSVRNIYAYTGLYKGKTISVMASGMGNPSMGIYSYELFKVYNVENIIRIGTCGAYKDSLDLKDLILVDSSYSDSSFAKVQNNSLEDTISSSSILNSVIENTANAIGINITKEKVYCSDVFYSDISDFKKLRDEYNCAAIEMETFALFHNAKVLNKNASCILSVSDSFVKPDKLTSAERQNSLNKMITLALESAIKA